MDSDAEGKGYLIASSQGNNSFVVYTREGNNSYLKSFRIVAGNKIDEVTETDGIHVTTANLGPLFPNGVFIAQDGFDDKGKQNFKLVPWQSIAGAIQSDERAKALGERPARRVKAVLNALAD